MWEDTLTQKAPAYLRLSLPLLEELGGADHVRKYGWEVEVYSTHAECYKTPLSEFNAAADRFTDALRDAMLRVAVRVVLTAVSWWEALRRRLLGR